MKTLYLNMIRVWFDMVKSGVKKDEYRNITEYWVGRLFNWKDSGYSRKIFTILITDEKYQSDLMKYRKGFDVITFANGMTPPVPVFEVQYLTLEIGTGKKEWGAEEGKYYFILKLGSLL